MKTVITSFNPATGQFGVLQDPILSKIFNQILELAGAGISPISIGKGALPTPQAPTAPTTPVAPPIPTASPALTPTTA